MNTDNNIKNHEISSGHPDTDGMSQVPKEVIRNLEEKIRYWKEKLLDLTKRNRLIAFKDYKNSTLILLSSDPIKNFKALFAQAPISIYRFDEETEDEEMEKVARQQSLSLRTNNKIGGIQQEDNSEIAQEGNLPVFRELLSTLEPSVWVPDTNNKEAETRLYSLYLKSRESLREQGINTLFATFGFLHYYDVEHSDDELMAPLLLAPLDIQRQKQSLKNRYDYTFVSQEEEIHFNPAIAQKLKVDFNLELPEFTSEITIEDWFRSVERTIEGKERWCLEKKLCLGIFTFEKLQMYLDIEKFRDKVLSHPILQILAGASPILAGGFERVPEEEELDEKILPSEINHVLDADSSQHRIIEISKKGTSFVVQGPPGTGKSQTIVNIIAEFLAQDKRVLFVSEKMAALDVVKKRLDEVGLGHYCLELHSHRANKKEVLRQLENQLYNRRNIQTAYSSGELYPQLDKLRNELNQFGRELLETRGQISFSIYGARGDLARIESVPDIGYDLKNVLETPKEKFNQNLADLKNLEEYEDEINNYKIHLWKGTTITQLGIDVTSRLKEILTELNTDGQSLTRLIKQTQDDCALCPTSIDSIERVLSLLHTIKERPQELTIVEGWFKRDLGEELKGLEVIVENIDKLNEYHRHLAECYQKEFLQIDAQKHLDKLEHDFASFTRYFRPTFWQERREILSYATRSRSYSEMKEDLHKLQEINLHRQENEKLKGEIQHLLNGNDKSSDEFWRKLRDITAWVHQINIYTDGAAPSLLTQKIIGKDHSLQSLLDLYTEIYEQGFKSHLRELLDYFDEGFSRWSQPLTKTDVYQVIEWFNHLQDGLQKLRDWVEFNNHLNSLDSQLRGYVGVFLDKAYKAELLTECYRKIFLKAFLKETENEITQLSGKHYAEEVLRFRNLDRESCNIARQRIVDRLEQNKPQVGAFAHTTSSEMAILRKEILKERRHLPLRELLTKAPNLISSLKPCFMMSPLSVAQYINLEKIEPFDLVIFDEASQIMPEDAISSLTRAKQAIVVGDSQQLPPTRFFASLDEEPEIEEELEDLNSILDETSAKLREGYLKWHYRSRDELLIAFSNHSFYDNRLVTFPNNQTRNGDTGVEFVYLKDGIYDRGNSRQNWKEADKVVELIQQHIEHHSKNKSLGVVAFSIQQQRAIQDRIEMFVRQHPKYTDFFEENVLNEFFVKNLENVQGDERDVMIFSIGYGPDNAGRMTSHFGPINRQGGYKRLNVAITRAREKVYLVSSFQPERIDLEETSNQGVRYLIQYMKYARDGIDAIAGEIILSGIHSLESGFEEAVYDRLRERGWDLATQVGTSGYRIDLAVKHPQQKGKFILGIECDGSAYHSSKTARDRDRLRQAVLERLGWEIYRIWSSDWLLDHNREVVKIENRLNDILESKQAGVASNKLSNPEEDQRSTVTEKIQDNVFSLELPEYKVAQVTTNRKGADAFHGAGYVVIEKQVEQIIRTESPIHTGLLIQRIVRAWGLSRAGTDVRSAVANKVGHLINRGVVIKDGDVLWYGPKKELVTTRLSTEDQRPFNLIPYAELGWLAIELLKHGFSAEKDDLIFEIAKQLGYTRRGAKIQSHLEGTLEYLGSMGKIRSDGQRIELIRENNSNKQVVKR